MIIWNRLIITKSSILEEYMCRLDYIYSLVYFRYGDIFISMLRKEPVLKLLYNLVLGFNRVIDWSYTAVTVLEFTVNSFYTNIKKNINGYPV